MRRATFETGLRCFSKLVSLYACVTLFRYLANWTLDVKSCVQLSQHEWGVVGQLISDSTTKGQLQKHSLAIVYHNQWLNWFPQHHPDRPYRPNCSNQIGRSRTRSFVFAMFPSSHLQLLFNYSRSYLKHCLSKSLFLESAQSVLVILAFRLQSLVRTFSMILLSTWLRRKLYMWLQAMWTSSPTMVD